MNKKAFVKTNLMLMQWLSVISLHSMLAYFLTSIGRDVEMYFAEEYMLIFFIALPMLYLFLFMTFMIIKWVIVEPIRSYYKEKCLEDE